MKLYFSPGACSLAPHIVLIETGLAFTSEKVDLRATPHKTEGGVEFTTISSKGYVPALALHNNELLTEGPAIVQYLADLAPEKNLAPRNGTLERYHLQAWLNFISTEIHKGFGPLWNSQAPAEAKQQAQAKLEKWFAWLDRQLAGKDYLMGTFTVADAYLFTCLNWCGMLKLSLDACPTLKAYVGRVAGRPAVQQAMKEEGLIKD